MASPPAAPPLGATLLVLLRTRSFVCLGLVSGITSLAVQTLFHWLSPYLKDKFHLELKESGLLSGLVLSVPGIAGILVSGYLSDSVSAKDPARRMLLFAFLLVFTVPCTLWFSLATSATAVLTATGLLMLTRSLAETNWHPIMYDLVTPPLRSTATGITNAFNCAVGGLGRLLVGELGERKLLDLQGAIGLVSVLLALAVALLFLAHRFFLRADLVRPAGTTG